MSLENIDEMKYAELRQLAKTVGIRANLKAEKLRCALKEHFEQNSSVNNDEKSKDEEVNKNKRRRTHLLDQTSRPKKHKRSSTYELKEDEGEEAQNEEAPPSDLLTDDESGEEEKTKQQVSSDLVSEDEEESCSPGVKEVVNAMTDEMSNEQLKETLMDALNRRAKAKVEQNAPVPYVVDSQIPRLTTVGSVKTYSQKKPITPGERDWSKIHARQFDRMVGLDQYLEARKQRSEALTQSMKKMRMLTQQMRSAVNTSRAYRTPPSLLKGGGSRIAKPDKRPAATESNKSLNFLSPAKPFVPTVTSTSKANFNFASMAKSCGKSPATASCTTVRPTQKTHKTQTSSTKAVKKQTPKPQAAEVTTKTPCAVSNGSGTKARGAQSQSTPADRQKATPDTGRRLNTKNMITPGARKSPRLSGISQMPEDEDHSPTVTFNPNASLLRSSSKEHNKGILSAKKVTLFRFGNTTVTLNNSVASNANNTSVSKQKFDLAASLARPLTWKPHRGKLQPQDNVQLDAKQATVVARSAAAAKERRRAAAQRERVDKRQLLQMKRRGLAA